MSTVSAVTGAIRRACKPDPAMLPDAAADHGIDPAASWLAGRVRGAALWTNEPGVAFGL